MFDTVNPGGGTAVSSGAATASVPRRILHVTEAPLGGVISCLEDLLRGQTERDVDSIEVITPEINVEALGGVDSPLLRLTAYPHERGAVSPLLQLAWLTVSRARAIRPDIIHVHSSIAGALIRICRPLLPRRTRIVYCPHGWSFVRRGSRLKNWALGQVERALSLTSDRIVCVSAYEKRDAAAVGIADRRLVVIENGVSARPRPAEAPERAPSGPKTIVFAGRLDEQKGFDTYVAVLRALGPEARGLVIGRSIVSGSDPVDLPPNVELLGWQPRDKVSEVCAAADVLLMPSRWEGFPMVALEAMQAGTAVFATRVGGLQDIVVDHETGRLFEPDDASAMAAGIRETTREQFRSYGRAGEARFGALYTADRMNRRVWDLYRELCTLRDRPTDFRRFFSAWEMRRPISMRREASASHEPSH